ncbi:MAG: hypothetical protein EOP94_00170 [Zymomonas sp.]|nr:MAG: hypothetical protein EOP94_00170 [Zymomonas sp.]
MSFLCYLGRHKPSLQSVHFRKEGGHAALCEGCGVPLEREGKGSWWTAPAAGRPVRLQGDSVGGTLNL